MHPFSYLHSATQILTEYKGEEPFASFLKKYFSQHKKYGSRDRKHVAHLCYCYFRLGKALPYMPTEERILIGLFLCSDQPNEILEQVKPIWNDNTRLDRKEKFSIINPSGLAGSKELSIEDIFPWKEQLSSEIDHEKFCGSFLVQPDLFLRIRPGYENVVKAKLSDQNISFSEIGQSLSLPNASKIENIVDLDREAVVQDLSSQQTGNFFKQLNVQRSQTGDLKVWDCCAGSGGKSLILHDIDPCIDLTVSDTRASILVNLKKRFAKAGIKNYKAFVADLTKHRTPIQTLKFDIIICDAPCTGSGTWSRTPEQLHFFDERKIGEYSALQKKIVSNIIPQMCEGGFLLYITCSVFKQENEKVVQFIKDNFSLQLIKMELLKGYNKKADTMFVGCFQKS